MIIKKRRLSID